MPETDLGVSVAQSHRGRGRGYGGESMRRGGRGPVRSTPRAGSEEEALAKSGPARRGAGRGRRAESSSSRGARAPAPRERRPAARTLPPPPASAPAGHWAEPEPVWLGCGAAGSPRAAAAAKQALLGRRGLRRQARPSGEETRPVFGRPAHGKRGPEASGPAPSTEIRPLGKEPTLPPHSVAVRGARSSPRSAGPSRRRAGPDPRRRGLWR